MRAKDVRLAILDLFTRERECTFTQIEHHLALRSNLVSYHLGKMQAEGILTKHEEGYALSEAGERLLPRIKHLSGEEQPPIAVVLCAIVKDGKILLLRRAKRPYQGYWGLVGGKLRAHQSIEECALQEAFEETGLACTFERLCGIVHERVAEAGAIKHAFILHVCLLSCENEGLVASDEGAIEWFPLDSLPDRLIPSDRMMIASVLEKDGVIESVVIEEDDGELMLGKPL